jgi:hypothetical protein
MDEFSASAGIFHPYLSVGVLILDEFAASAGIFHPYLSVGVLILDEFGRMRTFLGRGLGGQSHEMLNLTILCG